MVRLGNLLWPVASRSDVPLPLRPVTLLAKGIVQRAEALGTVGFYCLLARPDR